MYERHRSLRESARAKVCFALTTLFASCASGCAGASNAPPVEPAPVSAPPASSAAAAARDDASSGIATEKKRYKIVLDRPYAVGARRHIRFEVEGKSTISFPSAGANVAKASTFKLIGDSSTVALDEKKNETDYELAIDELTKVDGGSVVSLLPKQSRVSIHRERAPLKATVKVDGGPADADVVEALGELSMTTPIEDGTSDDDILGTSEPQPIGGTWPLQPKGVADALAGAGISVAPAGVVGRTTLHGIDHSTGIDCLDIRSEFDIDVNGGASSFTGKVKSTYRKLVPIDERLHAVAEQAEFTVDGTMSTPRGDARLQLTKKEKRQWTHVGEGAR